MELFSSLKSEDIYSKLMILKDKQSFLNVLGQEIAILKNPKISETIKFFSEDYDPKKENQQNAVASPPAQVVASPPAQAVASTPAATTPNISDASSDSELDFEQVLGSIIQEIQEEIFFWQ